MKRPFEKSPAQSHRTRVSGALLPARWSAPFGQFTSGKSAPARALTLALVLVGAALITGCATTADPNDPYGQTKRGAMIGAAIGAAAGLFVGDGELDEVLGTAAVGAGVGAGIGIYMDKQQRELEEIEGAEVVRVDEETLQVSFDSDILFAVDSAALSQSARDELNEFAGVMGRYPKTAIVVQGHTDSTGSEAYNQSLSERRANAVRNHLAAQGVAPDRMAALGYGEDHPVAGNDSTAGRAQNRRVTILVRGKS
jgi:outer membrane protein OmpA-like peptidoglycan-associated protein